MFDEILKAIAEVQQPRSRFQIEKFVLGQHSRPEIQYYQVLLELGPLLSNLRLAEIKEKKNQIKIARLRESGDEIDELEAQEIEIEQEGIATALIGTRREIAHLVEIFNSFEHKYTREEIEAVQQDYWRERLTNNAKAMLMGGVSVNPAHIEAMEQAGVLDSFVAEVEIARKELA